MQNNAYSALAQYYDRLMTDFCYEDILEYILSKISGKNGLDIACGSGAMTIELAKRGYRMTGIDYELNMLNVAREKAVKQAVNIELLHKNMLELEIDRHYDFCIAICDAFNYVPNEKAMKKLLTTIWDSLNAGGALIFDISSDYKLVEVLGDNLYFEDYDDFTYFWQNELNIKNHSVGMNLTFFTKEGELYARADEQHTQYYYKLDKIKSLLEAVGYHNIEVVDGENLEQVKPHSNRWLFFATKG